ncbi:MAG: hypothetical protein ACLRMX_04920 [Lachnospira eligens]
MKIRKVDDKPMVIHTKEKKPRLKAATSYIERGPKTIGAKVLMIKEVLSQEYHSSVGAEEYGMWRTSLDKFGINNGYIRSFLKIAIINIIGVSSFFSSPLIIIPFIFFDKATYSQYNLL